MSTKIYDAYKFDKKYSLDELMTIFDKWRNDITDIAAKNFADICLRKFAIYYDLTTVKGKDFIKEAKTKLDANDKKNRNILRIYELLENIDSKFEPSIMMMYIADSITDAAKDKSNEFNYFSQLMKSEICVYSVARKIIFMYFGGTEYGQYIASQPIVDDYHYQNQTDRPSDISENSWMRRRDNWDTAIGPDYIPANHGITVHFINEEDIAFSIFNKYLKYTNMSNDSFPTIDERANMLIDYFDDYPNPPEDKSYSSLMKYMRTDEYKQWKEAKLKYIKDNLNPNLYEIYTSDN